MKEQFRYVVVVRLPNVFHGFHGVLEDCLKPFASGLGDARIEP
jgi:hypothetical protein